MVQHFKDITLEWRGRSYVIPANRVFGAIARIEDYIVLADLVTASEQGRMPYAKASQAYAALLAYAGVQGVDPQDVYNDLFGDNREKIKEVALALRMLQLIMIPPAHLQEKMAGAEPGKAKPTDGSSSKPTRQRSAGNGARRRSSGRSRL